ncbi:DUF6925 family protein [Algihabitans albus]|uniref:DUF6925 family protein n=1 Tax=Algihabitans albus TaxID=2164067 RepID=UPI000E5D55D2|nr:hypothetical protein [Algihabitans albus]
MTERDPIRRTLREHFALPSSAFSIGSFGAIAEFHRRTDEPVEGLPGDRLGIATARGALRVTLRPDARGIAYETLSRDGRRWQQGVAFCLPEAAGHSQARRMLTPLGPDQEAIRAGDRAALLFDMGLGARNIDFCVRSADPDLVRLLERHAGESLLTPGHPAAAAILEASPHRIARSALGRLEVYQAIGRLRTPEGPHTHLLPKFLRSGRTHSANIPVPPGWLPALMLHPASAVSDENGRPIPYRPERQAAFEALRARFPDPAVLQVRAALQASLRSREGLEGFPPPADRTQRTALRVALRQLRAQGEANGELAPWIAAFDRAATATRA